MNELDKLRLAFLMKSPAEKRQVIHMMSQVVTIGCATVLVSLFYPFIPTPIRLISIPAILFLSYFLTGRMVGNILCARFEEKLNGNFKNRSQKTYFLEELFSTLKSVPSMAVIGFLICLSLFLCGCLFFLYN